MKKSNSGRNRSAGFTLIEIMITVAVVAILAAIAYPSYIEYVRKGRRAEARTALIELMQQEERYFTQRNTYLAFDTASTDVPFKRYSGDSQSATSYTLTAAPCTGRTISECVILTATPPTNGDPVMGNLTLDSTGDKQCTGGTITDAALCWR